jgi:hypothetical protein
MLDNPDNRIDPCHEIWAATASTAPNSLLMIRCGVSSVLINGSGFRHTILSAITQLLDGLGQFRSNASVGCDAVIHSCNGNHCANHNLLKIGALVDQRIARFRKLARIRDHA